MKKKTLNFIINTSFCVFVFAICILYSFFFKKLPSLVETSIGQYKFFYALKLFCMLLPVSFASSATISWCIEFGLNPGSSRLRFSSAMFSRFKGVLITSLIFVFFVSCANEIFLPQILKKLSFLESRIKIMKEYQNSAKYFFENKNYETAFFYAKLADEIDSKNKENKELLYLTELHNDKKEELSDSVKDKIMALTFNDEITSKKEIQPITAPYKSYELLKKARSYLENKDFFAAHYYATLALKNTEAKGINITELKQIAAEAWNELNTVKKSEQTKEEQFFTKKYEGYVSLINGDILRAYYVFHALSLESKKTAKDPDVIRYLAISQELLENQYFFTEETNNLQPYENANNIYFKIKNDENQHLKLYFIHGITNAKDSGKQVLYLRGLEVIELDENGFVLNGFYTSYAKMTSLETSFLDSGTKEELKIPSDVKNIPYILLNSTDRNFPNQVKGAKQKIGEKTAKVPNYLILNIPFDDIELIEQASKGSSSMNLASLFKFVKKSTFYGYSSEVFYHSMLNRMLKPIYLLSLFVIIAYFSWHFRLEEDSVFKFKWIIMFPLLCFTYIFLYRVSICLFKFINYGILNLFGESLSLIFGSISYIVILIFVSVFFLSCRNASGK